VAEWSSSYITSLPDPSFACINDTGRHYPHHDASGKLDLPHLRAALSRIGDPNNEQCGKGHLEAHAKAEGIGERGTKAMAPIKAKPLDPDEEDAFWEGKHPRRILVVPFDGPLPSPYTKRGVDLDGQWFHPGTDVYGGIKALRQTRRRAVDWHHSFAPPSSAQGDPTGKMTGALIGEIELDEEPEEDGLWAKFWAKAGERRINLIRTLQRRFGTELFGSSQAYPAAIKGDLRTGRIDVWPIILETISTSPQNTYSVIRPMKALLDDAETSGISASVKALLSDLEALRGDLAPTSARSAAIANTVGLEDVLATFDSTLTELRQR
jgi:hypothetical protein